MKKNKIITQELSILLASTYTMYLKVQNYHWNVEGSEFFAIHQFTEILYAELAIQNDDIAERIRTLGEKSPGTFKEYLELSCIAEAKNENSQAILKQLTADYSTLAEKIKYITALAGENNDEGTIDLLSPYLSSYEKTIWMLKSSQK